MTTLVRYYRMADVLKPGYVAVYGEWPMLVRLHRGWTDERCIHARAATDDETEWLSRCRRYQAIRYASTDDLLRDESEFLSPVQLETLTHALQRYPLVA